MLCTGQENEYTGYTESLGHDTAAFYLKYLQLGHILLNFWVYLHSRGLVISMNSHSFSHSHPRHIQGIYKQSLQNFNKLELLFSVFALCSLIVLNMFLHSFHLLLSITKVAINTMYTLFRYTFIFSDIVSSFSWVGT